MAHSDTAVDASPRASTSKPLDLSDCQSLKHYIRQPLSRPMRTVAGPTTSDVVVYPLHRSRIVAGTCGLKEALAPLQHFDYSSQPVSWALRSDNMLLATPDHGF